MLVGRKYFSLIDDSRYEVLNGGSKGRAIEVVLYYPIDDITPEKARAEVSPYLPKMKLDKINPTFKSGIKKCKDISSVYDNLDAIDGEFPVVFFSHGYGGYAEQNSRMVVELVKSGFIVVSVGHAYEASVIKLDDGSLITYNNKIKVCSPMIPALIAQKRIAKINNDPHLALEAFNKFQDKYCSFMKTRVAVWADDIRFVLAYLKEHSKDEKFILCNRMDFSRGVGTTGHSFGGCTSYYLCLNDSDFTCGINIDGAIFGDYEGRMKSPFLQISCDKNINLITRTITHRASDTYRLILKNMQHIGLSDGKLILPKMYSGKLEIEKMEHALFSAHIDFFSKYLKGKDNNFENVEKSVCEEVVFERFENN